MRVTQWLWPRQRMQANRSAFSQIVIDTRPAGNSVPCWLHAFTLAVHPLRPIFRILDQFSARPAQCSPIPSSMNRPFIIIIIIIVIIITPFIIIRMYTYTNQTGLGRKWFRAAMEDRMDTRYVQLVDWIQDVDRILTPFLSSSIMIKGKAARDSFLTSSSSNTGLGWLSWAAVPTHDRS